MDILTNRDMEALIEEREGPCVSIYLPTHPVGQEIQQDPVRLKNLLAQAREQLLELDVTPEAADEILAEGQALAPEKAFWEQQSAGLALFLAPGFVDHFRLPQAFEELAVVSDRFHIKPLLPLLADDGLFYALTLSQGGVALYQGVEHALSRVDVAQVPDTLQEVLRFDDPELHLQFHTATGTPGDVGRPPAGGGEGAGSRPAAFHGQGAIEQDDKAEIRRFFQRVDEGISDFLAGQPKPLVLVGVEFLQPLYREANSYPHLVEQGVDQDPGSLDLESLHHQVWDVVEPRLSERRRQAEDDFRRLAGNDDERATTDVAQVAAAAAVGRVALLFVARGRQVWGTFDAEPAASASAVEIHETRQPGDIDLLDLAAGQTLAHGGLVYVVDPDAVPQSDDLAAVLRY
jgi:hypothetical protein